jgi:sulfide dehydrogenase cytochrome subunit
MRSILAGLVLAAAGGAVAQPSSPPPAFAAPNLSESGVRAMAANCAPCHGTQGRAAPGSLVSGLAGKKAADIVQAMAQFKSGERSATLMHQIAKGYSDAEIMAMAEYFSKQPH